MSIIESFSHLYHRSKPSDQEKNFTSSLQPLTPDQLMGFLDDVGSHYQYEAKTQTKRLLELYAKQGNIHPHLAYYANGSRLYVALTDEQKIINLCDSKDKQYANNFIRQSPHHNSHDSSYLGGSSVKDLACKCHQDNIVFIDTGHASGIGGLSIFVPSDKQDFKCLLTWYCVNYDKTYGVGEVNIPEVQVEYLAPHNSTNTH